MPSFISEISPSHELENKEALTTPTQVEYLSPNSAGVLE